MKVLMVIALISHFLISSTLLSQVNKIDSLEKIVKQHKKDTDYVKALYTLSALVRNSDMQRAEKLAVESIELSDKLKFDKGTAGGALSLGTVNHLQGNYDKAEEYYLKAVAIYKSLGIKKNLSKCYNNLGNLFQLKADYSKALEYLIQGKKIAEELNDKTMQSNCELNIGNVYLQKKDYNNAINHYRNAYAVSKEVQDIPIQAQTLNNIGAVKRMLLFNDSALVYYKASLVFRKQLNDLVGISENLLNIGDVYFTMSKYDSALVYFSNAYAMYTSLGHKMGIVYSLNNIGSVLYNTKKDMAAIDTLLKVVKLTTAIGARDVKVEAYKNLGEIYLRRGNYKEGSDYLLKVMSLKDSLINETNNRQINEMQTKYESEKKDKEIIKQDAEIKNQQVESEKRAIERNALIAGLLLVLALALFIFKSFRQKQKANLVIEKQKKLVEEQRDLVEEKQKEIIDSINYAKRIQTALLASEKLLNDNLPEYFVLFKPKDIVAGDFYWGSVTPEGFIYVTADCTGHGVPGAFMSLLNISKLSESINQKHIVRPDLVFNDVRREIVNALNPEGSTEESKDGMDATLCKLDLKNMRLEFAAANNSFYIIRDKEILICRADKMPVGKSHETDGAFTYNEIGLQKGDMIFTFTDGYADQFGGAKGKKFKYKQMEELMISISELPMGQQKQILDQRFEEWKGHLEQVDDVLIIGVRI